MLRSYVCRLTQGYLVFQLQNYLDDKNTKYTEYCINYTITKPTEVITNGIFLVNLFYFYVIWSLIVEIGDMQIYINRYLF